MPLILRFALALALVSATLGTQARASEPTCPTPTIAEAFEAAKTAKEEVIIAAGAIASGLYIYEQGEIDGMRFEELSGHLIGNSLSRAGFTTPFNHRIEIRIGCPTGEPCPYDALPEGEALVFLKRVVRDGRRVYILDLMPCQTSYFPNPTAKMIERALACHRGGDCI